MVRERVENMDAAVEKSVRLRGAAGAQFDGLSGLYSKYRDDA
jgi:hypothetical protein